LVLVFAISVVPTMQVPEQQSPPPEQSAAAQAEQEALEEEHIRSRAENGESHASGGRPELGPVILGNPTTAIAALRVGLHTTTFNAAGGVATEFSSLHHTFVELTNTDGDVKIIDRSSGKEISVMTPGSLVRVEHDGTAFLVLQDGVFVGRSKAPSSSAPTSKTNLFAWSTSAASSAARKCRSIAAHGSRTRIDDAVRAAGAREPAQHTGGGGLRPRRRRQ
jgi:hypothetical protein